MHLRHLVSDERLPLWVWRWPGVEVHGLEGLARGAWLALWLALWLPLALWLALWLPLA